MKALLKRGAATDATSTSPRARLGLGGNLAGAPDPGRPTSAEDLPAEKNAQERWTNGSVLATRAVSGLLMACLAAGPVALVWKAVDSGPAPVAQQQAEVTRDSVARRAVASEQAAAWVQAWLTTPRERAAELRTWWTGPVDLPVEVGTASDVRVVDAVATAPGVWAVTVAATVTPPKGEPTRRYFMVPVQVDGGAGDAAASVKALPAPVQAPPAAQIPTSPYGVTVPSGSPVTDSVQAFMNAYLTGEGDVSRYVTPGSSLQAISESPQYAAADVVSVRITERVENVASGSTPTEGQVLHALVEVRLTELGAKEKSRYGRTASWPLTLTARDGRWEITDLDGTFQTTAEKSSAASTTTHKE